MDRPTSFQQIEHITSADDIARRSCADIFSARDRPLALFTPALLVTHAGFDRDPVIEFDARFPAESGDQRPFFTELQHHDEAFFAGLGAMPVPGRSRVVNWDRRLYCIDANRAEECYSFIGGIAFSNPQTGVFSSVFSYDMAIPDPTSRHGQFLNITVFGVISNTFIALLEAQLLGPPRARRIQMHSADAGIQFLRARGVASGFTGEDPLTMRE